MERRVDPPVMDAATMYGGEDDDFSFAGAIWRRKWIVLLMLGTGLALGYLYFAKAPQVYQSSAQLLLIEKKANLPVQGVEGQANYQNALSTQMLLLRSPTIIERAVREHDLAKLPSLRGSGNPVAVVASGLSVAQAGGRNMAGADVIALSYSGPVSDDCRTILEAVVASYEDFLGVTYKDFSQDTVTLITQAKDELHRQLLEKEGEYRRFRTESPLLWKGKEGANIHAARMAQIEGARSSLVVEISQLQARIEALEAAMKSGGNRQALALLVANTVAEDGKSTGPAARNDFEASIFKLMLDEQRLLESYGPDHPKVRAVRKEMELVREYFGSRDPAEKEQKPADFLVLYLDSLKQEMRINEERMTQLDKVFHEENDAAKSLADFEIQDETYRSDIARTQEMFAAVMKRLEEINLVKDYGGVTTEVISAPGMATQIAPKLPIIATIGGVFGLLVGIGLGYLIDVSDRRFQSPEDVQRQLGLPLYGHIPVLKRAHVSRRKVSEAVAKMEPTLVAFHRAKGTDAEAYRAVRTSIYFDARAPQAKVFQITSPTSGDGKTTLAANLALSIADSGKRVLLLDADFRLSRVAKVFGIEARSGLADLLAGKAELPEVIVDTPAPNLWVVPCGDRPQRPAELLTSPRLKELLDVLREQYDYIIIDTPPVLPVTDAMVVAPRVDGVLLVLRLTKHARGASIQALQALRSVGANVLGTIVNAVGRGKLYGYGGKSYRYGYGGKYGYGRGYGYGQRYGYGYGYGYGHGYGHDRATDGEEEREAASPEVPEKDRLVIARETTVSGSQSHRRE